MEATARVEKQLQALEAWVLLAIEGAEEPEAVEQIRIRVLGRKGELTEILRGLGALPPEIRREVGQQANTLKTRIEAALGKRQQVLRSALLEGLAFREAIDITLPGRPIARGSLHPLTATLYEIIEVFQHLGFSVAEGPEVELDYYNFEALNIPKDHPARDMQDTFYVTDDVLLRTHTSPVQIRVMETQTPIRPIPRCSIKWRGSWSIMGSALPTSREPSRPLSINFSGPGLASVSGQAFSLSPSPAPRWILPA